MSPPSQSSTLNLCYGHYSNRIVSTIIAPSFFTAAIFALLGRVIQRVGTEYSWLTPRWCEYIQWLGAALFRYGADASVTLLQCWLLSSHWTWRPSLCSPSEAHWLRRPKRKMEPPEVVEVSIHLLKFMYDGWLIRCVQ